LKPKFKPKGSKYSETITPKTTQTLIPNVKAHNIIISIQKPKLKP
jgi:hypothetical protein